MRVRETNSHGFSPSLYSLCELTPPSLPWLCGSLWTNAPISSPNREQSFDCSRLFCIYPLHYDEDGGIIYVYVNLLIQSGGGTGPMKPGNLPIFRQGANS